MVKAEIKTKAGTNIIIDGSEEEVKKILGAFYVEEETKNVTDSILKTKENTKLTIADMILELKEEGFFKEPKSLIEIKNILSQKGHIYPMTTLSSQIIRLLRKRYLGRIRNENKWKYVNR